MAEAERDEWTYVSRDSRTSMSVQGRPNRSKLRGSVDALDAMDVSDVVTRVVTPRGARGVPADPGSRVEQLRRTRRRADCRARKGLDGRRLVGPEALMRKMRSDEITVSQAQPSSDGSRVSVAPAARRSSCSSSPPIRLERLHCSSIHKSGPREPPAATVTRLAAEERQCPRLRHYCCLDSRPPRAGGVSHAMAS